MKRNFNICVSKVLQDEGGYTNDPSDSGGETKYGITTSDTSTPIRDLTRAEAISIYKHKYWDSLSCDNLSSGVDYTCFDYGVNSGLGRPRKALQRFKSLKGTELIDAINNERTTFLKALADQRPKDKKFLNGWLNRVKRVRNYSHYLSTSGKNDKTGTVVSVGITLAGMYASTLQYFEAHKLLVLGGVTAGAILIGYIIHRLRNK